MTSLANLQNMFQQNDYMLFEGNDRTFADAHTDLQRLMRGAHRPTWLSVVYSSACGLIFVMRGTHKPHALRYMSPYYVESAQLIVEVAGIHVPNYSQARLGQLFGTYPQVALTELGSEPHVSVTPALSLPAPPA